MLAPDVVLIHNPRVTIKMELPETEVCRLLSEWRNRECELVYQLDEVRSMIESAEAQLKGLQAQRAGQFPQGSMAMKTDVKQSKDVDVAIPVKVPSKIPGEAAITKWLDKQELKNAVAARIRNVKGQNIRIVKEYLRLAGPNGATPTQISRATGIGLSSVRLVLDSNDTIFSKDQAGLWTIKPKECDEISAERKTANAAATSATTPAKIG